MISRRFFISGIITTAAVASASQYIPAMASKPQLYATVYGVGWDLEVIEHHIYEPMSVAHFGGTPDIDKFREVTAFVHAFPVEPMPETYNNSAYLKRYGATFGIPAETISTQEYGEHAIKERTKQIAYWQKEPVKDDGFTRIMGFDEIDQWREAQRPDLDGRFSHEWIEEQLEGYRKFGGEPAWLTDGLKGKSDV
jgi:hypothetical protein